jgi:RNA polymerase sigma factor (sigma-70 family)
MWGRNDSRSNGARFPAPGAVSGISSLTGPTANGPPVAGKIGSFGCRPGNSDPGARKEGYFPRHKRRRACRLAAQDPRQQPRSGIAEFGRQKRDLALERSLELAVEASSALLEEWLAKDGSGPLQQAERNERLERLASALTRLPDAQREALELRHLQGRSVAEISRQMGRSEASTAGLLRRGLKQMRELLADSP